MRKFEKQKTYIRIENKQKKRMGEKRDVTYCYSCPGHFLCSTWRYPD